MSSVIHVINASSRADTGITADIERSLSWARGPALPEIRCVTLEDGPNGIVSARDSDDAAPAVLRYVERHGSDAAGFVIACFSDPGVFAARDLTRAAVVGIGEAGYLAALSLGDTIATIGVSSKTDKTARMARQMGIDGRIACHLGLGLNYGELQDPGRVRKKILAAGRQIRDAHDVQALVFAGAGLARYVEALQDEIGIPVIDPTQSALASLLPFTAALSCS